MINNRKIYNLYSVALLISSIIVAITGVNIYIEAQTIMAQILAVLILQGAVGLFVGSLLMDLLNDLLGKKQKEENGKHN